MEWIHFDGILVKILLLSPSLRGLLIQKGANIITEFLIRIHSPHDKLRQESCDDETVETDKKMSFCLDELQFIIIYHDKYLMIHLCVYLKTMTTSLLNISSDDSWMVFSKKNLLQIFHAWNYITYTVEPYSVTTTNNNNSNVWYKNSTQWVLLIWTGQISHCNKYIHYSCLLLLQ